MLHEEHNFTSYDGLQLYAQSWLPDGAAKANLVVVHGIGEHCGRYDDFAVWFVPLGYAVHTFDLRGHGRSAGRQGYIQSWADFREDVRVFLNRIAARSPDLPVFLVGHSLGGLIALDYALHDHAGLAGVVVSGPALAIGEGTSAFLLALAKVLSSITPGLQMHSKLDVTGLSRDEAVIRAYQDDPLVHDWATPRLAAEMQRVMQQTMAHASDWPADLPLLIVHGGSDTICPAEASERFYVNAGTRDKTRHVYPDFFHEVYNDLGREQVLQDVADWLAAHL